jgi:hypothetical protein
MPNMYHAPNIAVGPRVPRRTAEEWETAPADTEAEILRTLYWIGGYHAAPDPKPIPNFLHEDLDEARLVADIHGRAGVQRRIVDLMQSRNPWVREAAAAAAVPHYTKLQGPYGIQ